MNPWLACAFVLLVCVAPCLLVVLRSPHLDALVALELATTLVTVTLVLLAEGFHRSSYFELGIVAAALGFVGNLVFIRFLDRDL